MGLESCATWDLDRVTWGGRAKGVGTVQDRIMLNLLKINQKPGNINARMKIRRKAESESSVFKNKSYIEAQIIKNPNKLVIVFIDDILIYSKTKEDHEVHLKLVLELLKNERLYAKFFKCEFWLQEVHFLGHVVNHNCIHVDPSKIKALTRKNKKYEWGAEQEEAFQTLKDNLCNTPIPSLSGGIEDFVVYCDVSNQGLGCVLIQRGKTLRHYLYETKSVIYTDHKSLQHIFDQKELNMHQRRWIELFSDYECEILYHPAQSDVLKEENAPSEILHGLDQHMKGKKMRAYTLWIAYGFRLQYREVSKAVHQRDRRTAWSACANYFRSRWTVYITFLANITESLRDAIRYEYGLSSSNGWIKSAILWAEIRESMLIGPELVQETTDKVVFIKEKLKAARGRQKSYADNRRLFKILERIVHVPYRLRFPEELSSVHDIFHVSNLKKCLADANLHVPLDEMKIDKALRFVEEPVEIMDHKVKSLKRSKISIVKVRWNSKSGPEFT
nr:hypothetical protein [Tanacetum cinerariifolium]